MFTCKGVNARLKGDRIQYTVSYIRDADQREIEGQTYTVANRTELEQLVAGRLRELAEAETAHAENLNIVGVVLGTI